MEEDLLIQILLGCNEADCSTCVVYTWVLFALYYTVKPMISYAVYS